MVNTGKNDYIGHSRTGYSQNTGYSEMTLHKVKRLYDFSAENQMKGVWTTFATSMSINYDKQLIVGLDKRNQ